MTMKPEEADAQTTFKSVQSLRALNDLAIETRACCLGNRNVLEIFFQVDRPLTEKLDGMRYHRTKLSDNIESIDALEKRIRNAIDLVCFPGRRKPWLAILT